MMVMGLYAGDGHQHEVRASVSIALELNLSIRLLTDQ